MRRVEAGRDRCWLPDPAALLFGVAARLRRHWMIGCCVEVAAGAELLLVTFGRRPRWPWDPIGPLLLWLFVAGLTTWIWVAIRAMLPVADASDVSDPVEFWRRYYRSVLAVGWLALSIAGWLFAASLLL